MKWRDFEREEPEIAGLARTRFEATKLVLLGTLRKDGFPRITPVEWVIFEGDLTLGGMWQSRKCLDLLRDPRCVIHSTTCDKSGQEGDVKLYGRAEPLAAEREETYWQRIFQLMNWRPDGPAHVFTIDIQSAAYVTFAGDGTMRWRTWPNGAWQTKRSS